MGRVGFPGLKIGFLLVNRAERRLGVVLDIRQKILEIAAGRNPSVSSLRVGVNFSFAIPWAELDPEYGLAQEIMPGTQVQELLRPPPIPAAGDWNLFEMLAKKIPLDQFSLFILSSLTFFSNKKTGGVLQFPRENFKRDRSGLFEDKLLHG